MSVIDQLTPFECWMVARNLEYAAAEGLERTAERLRDNGYPRVAAAVEEMVQNPPQRVRFEDRTPRGER